MIELRVSRDRPPGALQAIRRIARRYRDDQGENLVVLVGDRRLTLGLRVSGSEECLAELLDAAGDPPGGGVH